MLKKSLGVATVIIAFGCLLFVLAIGRPIWIAKYSRPQTIEDARKCLKNHDYFCAQKILVPLADKGDSEAQFMLGEMARLNGDTTEANRRYEQAGKAGHPKALYRLGFYKLRDGNLEEGISLLTEAASRGSRDAQTQLGDVYNIDWPGVKRDPSKAMNYYTSAAEASDNFAQQGVASIYEDQRNFGQAYYYLQSIQI
jgi:uncharacterized protein